MRPGQVIELKDIGTRFSGSYYVTAVEHRYTKRNGYVTHFKARRNSS
jgi:phage protein D